MPVRMVGVEVTDDEEREVPVGSGDSADGGEELRDKVRVTSTARRKVDGSEEEGGAVTRADDGKDDGGGVAIISVTGA